MSAQGDCEFLVQRARELVQQDLWAAKAWLITARSLYPADFNIQYEMYTIERNAERTNPAGRLLYDMFVNFPDQPVVWREISIITSALRNDSQDKQTQFLRSLFETLPGRVQCEMLLKVTEQCFNTLERSEMLLLLLRRFPETVVQHGVGLGEALLEAETIEEQESPVNCFRKLFVCDVLPLIINNHDVRLPANLLYKYLNKAAEFYINYVTRSTQVENQHQGVQETSDLMSPSKRSSQKYIIEGLTEKSSQIVDPWERLFKILNVVGMRCEWQMDKGRRSYGDILHRMKDLCRYMNNFDNEAHAKYKNQVVYSTMLVFFKNAFQYVNSIQPSLFQGPNAPSQVPLVLLEDVSNVYGDIEIDRNKHIHKKRKLAEGREKPMQSSDDEDCSAKGRNRHIVINKAELANSIEVLESFKLARESWELLYSLEFLDKEFTRICLAWKTDTWLWLRIFLTDMIIYQGQYKKAIASLHHLAALQGSLPQPQLTGQGTLEHQSAAGPRARTRPGRGPSMAEPLLRKTFSRLRGREKLPRKKSDAKERGHPAQRLEPSPPEPEPQAFEGSQAGAEGPPSPEAPRSPSRGAYLQSLEPSSRRWVLGGAKPPEEVCLGPGAPGSGEPAGEIWYNPIPEEDPRTPAPETPGPQPGLAEPEGVAPQGVAPSNSPTKASRTKSPGPARRLSMKMKKLPELRRRLSLRSTRAGRERERERAAPAGSVISRYHLDSSVGTPGRTAVAGGSRGLRAGYLSDGDSPERPAGPLSPTAFQPYEVGPSARAPPAALWGRLSLHLYGLGGLRPAPGATPRDLCCLLQVDGVARARTGPLRGGPDFLRLDHTFHLELEAARLLRALVLVWDPCVRRHRPCAQGTVLLPTVFRGCQAQQLAVRLEPQGLLYAKLALTEQREAPNTAEPRVFGLPLRLLVEREQPPGQVPLIIQKCVGQIERRGLRVVGLYRLCGSAAVKKELRDAFERDSAAVCLSEDLYPDINVITGILKDYLRELPTPLITQPLYQVVLEAMARGPPSRAPPSTEGTRGLLGCLPDVERATLTLLLDHLRLVSSFHTHNRMTAQNLAVCFGPVLLPARQDPGRPRSRSSGPGLANTVDFKRHIEVLHYLLQAWPDPRRSPEATDLDPYLRPKQQPPLHLPLAAPEVVTRPRGRGGPESPPSNRYAGDWSVCGRDFLPCGRDFLSGPDYDHVTGSDSEDEEAGEPTGAADFEDDFEAPFNAHLNLKDFDALILDLERELSKQINVCL